MSWIDDLIKSGKAIDARNPNRKLVLCKDCDALYCTPNPCPYCSNDIGVCDYCTEHQGTGLYWFFISETGGSCPLCKSHGRDNNLRPTRLAKPRPLPTNEQYLNSDGAQMSRSEYNFHIETGR